ncbi:FAD binding domain-containing protein [Bacteriovoracaceae bacterium]|nr:FAD binding domain-containing protein [Bacteriovoracaceae bacterium]
MQNSITLWINQEKHQISGRDIFKPLSSYLREDCQLTGTKVVCGEGDCGACSVLMKDECSEQYMAINSCIAYLYGLHNKQIVTVEHLSLNPDIQKLQKNFVNCGASQCGYCTPGIICTLADLYQKKTSPKSKHIKNALTGNLCRCTGYESILEAATKTKFKQPLRLETVSHDLEKESLDVVDNQYHFHAPQSWREAIELKKNHPELKIVANLTDLGVVLNKLKVSHYHILSLQNIETTQHLFEHEGNLVITPAATIHDVEEYCENIYPEVSELLRIFASPQIKNRATIIGNVANGSPIGDTIPFLLMAKTQVKLISSQGERIIALEDFYIDYKKFNLRPDELIKCLLIPLETLNELSKGHFRLYKVSKRKDLDISAVTLAMSLALKNNQFQQAHLCVGGVGPVVMNFIFDSNDISEKNFGKQLIKEISDKTLEKIAPMSDHRGSAKYRNKLVENLIKKFFYDEKFVQEVL